MNENEINLSDRVGYDVLIGANNGEETRRANNLTPWKTDYEIYNQ